MGALDGVRVLVPRGGELGARLAAGVEHHGGTAVVAPMIEFTAAQGAELRSALERLSAGAYDWLAVTSATTVDVLVKLGATVPQHTRVAAVGPATASALREHGIRVDFVPTVDYSAEGLVAGWPAMAGRVLLPQSAIAAATLAEGLSALGLVVDVVTAYRTGAVELDSAVRSRVAAGEIGAVLITSGSIARQIAAQLAPLPGSTRVVCIGASSADAATSAGLRVDAVAERSDGQSLIDALVGLNA